MVRRAGPAIALLAPLLIGALAAWVFWPGVVMYDSVAQYGQVLSGEFDDWHPPIMAWLWRALHLRFGGGAAPMLMLQVGLYSGGFALLAHALASTGRVKAALATIVLMASPLLLGWQVVVLKDAQMLGALMGAVGLIAAYKLRERRTPVVAFVVLVLLAYATLVRSNAAFATVPLAFLLLPGASRMPVRIASIAVATLAVLAISPLINHRLLDAEPTTVAHSQPLFDLAGIAVRTPVSSPGAAFTPAERAQIVGRHCVKAFFWDPLGDDQACADATKRLDEEETGTLFRQLGAAALAHPLAYVHQRLAHWNSTERWLVPSGLPSAAPPGESEPNDVGLSSPGSRWARTYQALAGAEAGTPLGWPIVWTFVALVTASVAFERRDDATGQLALALAGSALFLEASFLLVSIASDLRYHLWPMTSSALALILLLDGTPLRRAPALAAATLLAGIIGLGLYTRATLPIAPATYRAMIEAPTG